MQGDSGWRHLCSCKSSCSRSAGDLARPVQDPLPVWVAVGGTPESAVRAGMLVLPMALGIIGGMPERFAPFVEVHRRAAGQAGHGRLPVSVNSHGYIAETREQAAEDAYPPYALMMNRIGRGRGWPRCSARTSTPR